VKIGKRKNRVRRIARDNKETLIDRTSVA